LIMFVIGVPASSPPSHSRRRLPGPSLHAQATSKLVQTGKIEEWTGDFKATAKEVCIVYWN